MKTQQQKLFIALGILRLVFRKQNSGKLYKKWQEICSMFYIFFGNKVA